MRVQFFRCNIIIINKTHVYEICDISSVISGSYPIHFRIRLDLMRDMLNFTLLRHHVYNIFNVSPERKGRGPFPRFARNRRSIYHNYPSTLFIPRQVSPIDTGCFAVNYSLGRLRDYQKFQSQTTRYLWAPLSRELPNNFNHKSFI